METGYVQALISAESGGNGSAPAPEPPSTVAFAVPGSDVFPLDLFHIRRALIGGTLARCWVAWTTSQGMTVLDFEHNGSSADPTAFVPALAGATRITVDLGAVSRTAEEVAQDVAQALIGEGIGASVNGSTVTVQDASDLIIPDEVDLTDTSLRGMWGMQRDDWGSGSVGQTLNQNGGTDGTGSVHLGPLGSAGRILGVYLWTRTDGAPMPVRLACSTGPAYDPSPGAMTILGQGQLSAFGLGATTFEAVAVGGADNLWAHYRGDNGGGVRYRAHASTPVGRGQLGLNETLVWDTTSDDSANTAFGASYTPTVNNNFNIYVSIGVIFEIPDVNGNYPANGEMTLRIGDQNNDPNHGVQVAADSVQLSGENTHQRFLWINWTDVSMTTITRTVAALGAGEDSRVAIYQWTDLDHPSITPATLVSDLGLMGMTPVVANTAFTRTLPTPLPVGTADVGDDAILSLGFNYVTVTGVPLATYALPVFIETLGDGAWLNAWQDDRETWHDQIPGASERAYVSGVQEYRQRNVDGSPYTSTAQTWPDPMVTDASDDSPPAIALDWVILRRAGISAA